MTLQEYKAYLLFLGWKRENAIETIYRKGEQSLVITVAMDGRHIQIPSQLTKRNTVSAFINHYTYQQHIDILLKKIS